MSSYKVFTIESGCVSEGAKIENLHLKGANIDIPAILVGEEGRGRHQEAVPVDRLPMVPCPERGKVDVGVLVGDELPTCARCGTRFVSKENEAVHPTNAGQVVGALRFAEVGQTKSGKPKFVLKDSATTDENVVVVFRTKIGFRGGNAHTGDRAGWKCTSCNEVGAGEVPETCPKCGASSSNYSGPTRKFDEFPGQKLAVGSIAQGDAGRMGSGEQLVAVMPKGIVFRTSYSGRLYGNSSAHYYMWDGEKLLFLTWEEREAADIF